MSDFLRRWSARKHGAQQIPTEQATADAIPALSPEADLTSPDAPLEQETGAVQDSGAKIRGDEPPATKTKPGLPDKEALRALFRTQQPDGLDDYNQDFSKPELLPAILTAGLRHWLATPSEPTDPAQQEPQEPLPTARLAEPSLDRDILPQGAGQNVPSTVPDAKPLGS